MLKPERVSRMAGIFMSVLAPICVGQSFPTVDELPPMAQLPDPFRMFDGTPVRTKEDWFEKRRPELKTLFQHYMYGYIPDAFGTTFEEEAPEVDVLDGKATLKQIVIRFGGLPSSAPQIHLALVVPKKKSTRVPVFLAVNKCGNYAVLEDEAVIVNQDADYHTSCPSPPEEHRGHKKDSWCVDYLIDRGYAFATFHESDIDPDKHDFTDGIHPYYPNLPGPKESRWGTIAAWAWGLHRCVDYLITDDDIDPAGICLTGHSRRGKTALFAAAMDDRVALAVPHQSGTGGCALSRDNDQETIERINRVFPHWFNDQFPKFNGREEKLPFDQHLLIALMAPRPFLDTAGLQDTWANYESAYRALKAADKVYQFLGLTGIKGTGLLEGSDTISADTAGKLLQYRLDTRHELNVDYWKAILDFADVNL